jgi:dienelactone hydrolase
MHFVCGTKASQFRRLFLSSILLVSTSSFALADSPQAEAAIPAQAKVMVSQKEISIPFQPNDTIAAYLVEANGSGKKPAVLYLHWLGAPNGDKREFLPDANEIAKQGTVALLIDMAWARPHWFSDRKLRDDLTMSNREISRIETALGFLAQRAEVDASRIAIVGHDFGAMYGMLATRNQAGKQGPQIAAFISVASTPRMSDWFFYGQRLSADDEAAYIKQMAALDPIRNAPYLEVPALFQFAKCDEFISQTSAAELAKAYKGNHELKWYPGDHELNVPEARSDRLAWLSAILKISKPE